MLKFIFKNIATFAYVCGEVSGTLMSPFAHRHLGDLFFIVLFQMFGVL